MDSFFGEAISQYTTEQAIEDGMLVHPFPKRWPWLLITASVHNACLTESENGRRTYDQCLIPLLQDCIMEVKRLMTAQPDVDHVTLEHTVAGAVWIVPNEMGGMTVMQPSDY